MVFYLFYFNAFHEIPCYFREVGRATAPAVIGRHGGRPYFSGQRWRLKPSVGCRASHANDYSWSVAGNLER